MEREKRIFFPRIFYNGACNYVRRVLFAKFVGTIFLEEK